MNTAGDAAEQVVRMSLEGTETAVRLAGRGAEHLARLLAAALKDRRKSRGRTRLAGLLRSGQELRVFAVADRDLRTFCAQARKYGILYTVLKDRDAGDGLTDLVVRAGDAPRASRIIERFGLGPQEEGPVPEAREGQAPGERETEEAFLERVFPSDPGEARTAPDRLSGPFSGRSPHTAGDGSERIAPRPSVRRQLERIRREQKDRAAAEHRQRQREPGFAAGRRRSGKRKEERGS